MINKAALKVFLGRNKLNQKQLAKKIGIHEVALSRKLNGTNPLKDDEIIKICEVLNITDPALRGKIFLNSAGNIAHIKVIEDE